LPKTATVKVAPDALFCLPFAAISASGSTMNNLWVGLLLSSVAAFAADGALPGPYDAVNLFIGTDADGNTSPSASVPFGMLQWGPDTRADGWYHYADKTIRGLSLTHISGAGCPIYADVPILPWTGEVTGPGSSPDFALAFSHGHEQVHPGCYAVEFDNGVRAELTVTTRAGIGRFMFPADAGRTLLIKVSDSATVDDPKRKADTSAVEIRGSDTIVGSVHSGGFCGSDSQYVLYFVLTFARPFSSAGTWTAAVSPGSTSAEGHKVGAYVSFPHGAEPIVAKVGVSFVSISNALANLQAEIPGWDFETVRAAAKARWIDMLERVHADGGTPEQRTIFYTGLYHMLLSPNLFNDNNGEYIGFDGKVRRLAPGEAQYANFSDWDIYRDVIPMHSLLLPAQASQMIQSLIRDAQESGWLPRWPVANDVSYVMGGDSPAILIAEAHAFGARAFAARTALDFMLKGATQVGTGPHGKSQRPELADWLNRGYVPLGDDNENAASVTLEYATADFAISRFAAAMGDQANAAKLLRSAQNWRNLADPETGFIRPRTADGHFVGGWDPDHLMPHHKNWDQGNQLGFEEGSTWQYTWMIPHNYAGLIAALGGEQRVVPKLDKFFEKLTGWALPYFTVTNEPDFCAPYAYVWTGNAWKTQEVVDRIRRETFTTKPDGLPGNDDLGATSGVYVWNALGLYPVIPGVGGLVLGTPMFSHATVRMGNGRTLEILSHGEGVFVQSVKLNGSAYDSTWLPLEVLSARENRLEFLLGTQPNKKWGALGANLPPSFDSPAM
jgi:predicted alpha-1,2-mannosidase